MSNWKVSKERITIFPHPNASGLELGKVGSYQVVVVKRAYSDGDEVVFVPEKSVLTGPLRDEFANYLVGKDKDRVKSITLRGEVSCGIILSADLVAKVTGLRLDELPAGEDISERLGITKYEPPIPTSLSGQVEPIPEDLQYGNHDCEQFGVYADQLEPGEDVVITEKLHGSQAIYGAQLSTGRFFVSSKGLLSRRLCLVQSDGNAYWQASTQIWYLILAMTHAGMATQDDVVQVFGELIPCQGGAWLYGQTAPTVKVFDVRVNGVSVPYTDLQDVWGAVWVPILYHGPYDPATVRQYRAGMEQVSGQELHIREGAVVRPYIDRRASDGTRLVLKLINPAYKETGEEIN